MNVISNVNHSLCLLWRDTNIIIIIIIIKYPSYSINNQRNQHQLLPTSTNNGNSPAVCKLEVDEVHNGCVSVVAERLTRDP
jgi:hypothetical protein